MPKAKKTSKSRDKSVLSWLDKFLRYTNYIGAAQLYLKENCLLDEELSPAHIKDRILGHWGTVPGQSFIYAHLNYLICKHKIEMIFMAGPGHGAPAVLANLFAEQSLHEFYPKYTLDRKGLSSLIHDFSWPGAFPSHTTPLLPGTILEGGELGYSLATAYGAALDNPELIVTCVVGDGEAETGPLATAWHSNKFLNPADSGAVLPILLDNGYKISGPTIYSLMSDSELKNLFTGFGYQVRIVRDLKPGIHAHQQMIDSLEWAYQQIRKIQKQARTTKKPVLKPQWPMIVYRCLKGASGIKKADGHKVEGLFHSHGIPLQDPKENPEHFQLIKKWLESYRLHELLDQKGRPLPEVLKFVPKGKYRMGINRHAIGGNVLKELSLPKIEKHALKFSKSGSVNAGNTAISSNYLADVFVLNKKTKNFRFMCPDETESNKFQSLFKVTKRAMMWPVADFDENIGPDGRVMEMLSEHTLQGFLQGYLLTGRHGMLATYEAFAMIVASMVDQHAKFLKYSKHTDFRTPVASLNYLLTSIGWRQEHNGYSHQNPGFISVLLEKHGEFCSVYLPPDANSLLVTFEDCLKRKNSINAIVASKQPMPQWLSLEQARAQQKTGIGIWDWIDQKASKNPDIVLAAAGDVMVVECLAAFKMLKKFLPELKVRFVNVSELTALGVGDEHHPLSCEKCGDIEQYFTPEKPVIFTFHGYPGSIRKLICGHKSSPRFKIFGYREEGTTTTPFDMMVLNQISRFHLVMYALEEAGKTNKKIAEKSAKIIKFCADKLAEHKKYVCKYGKDMDEVVNWKW